MPKELAYYLNDIPRIALGIVFLWFGVDKFIIHEFYLSWFSATERVTAIIPFDDLSVAIYGIGIIELIFAGLLFSGVGIRKVAIGVIVFLILILLTAQYPSSYPQDIGLLGIAFVLVLTNVTWSKAKTEKFLKYLPILRYSIAAVLLLWALDQIVNFDRHIGWLQLASPIVGIFPANGVGWLLTSIFITEIILAGLIASGKYRITKYSLIALTIFLLFAIMAFAPPINNHQTLGLAITTAWLAYISIRKNRV